MSEILQSAKQGLMVYKLAVFYGVLFSLNSLAAAIVASLLNTDWSSLSRTSKFLLVIVVVQNWTGTMIAFMNKTISRIQSGQAPIQTGDTQQITKPTA